MRGETDFIYEIKNIIETENAVWDIEQVLTAKTKLMQHSMGSW